MNGTVSRNAALYVAIVQLFFTLSWTVYAIYLPALAKEAGLAAGAVIWLLMLDQVIFLVCDLATGLASDRVSRVIGRLGYWVAATTLISCFAFLALPYVASSGSAPFVVFGVIWVVTSSALRAPPMMLLGKYAAKPSIPYLSSLALLGYGIAGAAAPYLAVNLRDIDPRIPFALASIAVAASAFGLAAIERKLARSSLDIPTPIASPQPLLVWRSFSLTVALLAAVMLCLTMAFQIHFNLNSAPLYLKFSTPADLEHLMPIFWIGFNVAMLPAGYLAKRFDAGMVMAVSALIGAVATVSTILASGPASLQIAQAISGAAWAAVLMSAFAAGFRIGDNGREGSIAGVVFATLAAGTVIRMAMSAGGIAADAAWRNVLSFTPAFAFAAAGLVLLIWSVAQNRRVSTG